MSVISYHNGRVLQALIELFPNIGLDKSRFLFSKSMNSLLPFPHFLTKYQETLIHRNYVACFLRVMPRSMDLIPFYQAAGTP